MQITKQEAQKAAKAIIENVYLFYDNQTMIWAKQELAALDELVTLLKSEVDAKHQRLIKEFEGRK